MWLQKAKILQGINLSSKKKKLVDELINKELFCKVFILQ